MRHIMRYLGRFEINFEGLRPAPSRYMNPRNREIEVFPPPPGFDGVMFYMMEDMRTGTARPVLVMVEDILLDKPVPIDYQRHVDNGKRVSQTGKRFSTRFARVLLDDTIQANPALRERLVVVSETKLQICQRNKAPEPLTSLTAGSALKQVFGTDKGF